MAHNQYPFWKDREIASSQSQADGYWREIQELKKKLKDVKCPKCGHTFNID